MAGRQVTMGHAVTEAVPDSKRESAQSQAAGLSSGGWSAQLCSVGSAVSSSCQAKQV